MNTLFRTTVIVLVVAAPLTLWAIGRHFASMPSSSSEAAHRGQEVERLEHALKNREEARKEAVQELLSQRRTLAETLQRFQELNRQWPDLSVLAREAKAQESDEQIAFRLILLHVELALSRQSEESAMVLRRLKSDYQQLQHAG